MLIFESIETFQFNLLTIFKKRLYIFARLIILSKK